MGTYARRDVFNGPPSLTSPPGGAYIRNIATTTVGFLAMPRTAKIFITGGSQAVRLPAEYRFDVDEVHVEKIGERLLLTPKRTGWDDFFARPGEVPEDFLADREDSPPQERDLF
jgi:antitoxin VapB